MPNYTVSIYIDGHFFDEKYIYAGDEELASQVAIDELVIETEVSE
jgi:hypothetical protein